jgi:hypothetical protein
MNPANAFTVDFNASTLNPMASGGYVVVLMYKNGLPPAVTLGSSLSVTTTSVVIPANELLPDTQYIIEVDFVSYVQTTDSATGVVLEQHFDQSTQAEFTTCAQCPVNSIAADAPYQVHYFANTAIGDSVINITNTGANGAGNGSGTTAPIAGAICANFYVFDQNEGTVSCCSWAVTPDGLTSLSVQKDLIANPLFARNNTDGIVVKVLATAPVSNSCTNSALLAGNPAPVDGLVVWGTDLHANTAAFAGTYQVTETPFTPLTLSGYSAAGPTGEYARLQYSCGVAVGQVLGSGICNSCKVGGLGNVKE